MAVNPHVRGGSFLLEATDAASVFTPEDFMEEQLMIAELTEQFVEGEVLPHDEQLEKQDFELTVKLLRQMGALGLLGADIPEVYGGTDLDKISSTLITEKLVRASSFALSFGAHVGIGSLPIALFGNEDQKMRYLPKLVSGETISAYCLTEPASGSDSLNARTTAKLNPEGTHYVLNGAKQFITNAGFAGLFIVYAKIDGAKFTAFIVERGYSGVSTGPEEKKMGIKGSSTRPLLLEDVHVPVENVLGEIGRGHVIAFNILNIGRLKLAAGCAGSAKWALELAIQYGKQRKQFGKPLVGFPLIQKKLADVAVRSYAVESMVYRTAGLIDTAMKPLDKNAADYSRLVAKAVEEYAMECSLNKVFATECLDFAADEGVQIHGGYGYIQEYMIERIYRDSRINRIFEGTNEINRLLIPATLLRKAMKGELPLFQAAERLQQELIAYVPVVSEDGLLAQETEMLAAAKKMFLMAGGMAVSKFGTELEAEQEVLEALANMIMEIYAVESSLLRAVKVSERDGAVKGGLKAMMAQVFVHESFGRIEAAARTAIVAMSDGDKLQTELSVLKKMTRFKQVNLISLKRSIASVHIAAGKYVT
ncbi:acyl-CoA dehydrogenase family protein [Paenibacillus contaminans]|uniref:Acyl-CoA dehydrogenase n=1 Tax=Paenibacillus contaminans TaxID=450362 RepID=A0A329MM04_9BACL|nr:acyl-CoA dehydrogenase family protein [Paenibacillus contaminans]RAV20640.1 acyl-CoA dehydrogenase [Paenibacillus contaminans]